MTATAAITFEARTRTEDDRIVVDALVKGVDVDRPETHGYVVKDAKMAARLSAAINAGVVFYDPEVRTDVNGRTYVNAPSRVLGRMMNADLRRLGF